MSGITTVGELGIMVPVEQAVLLGEVKAQDYHRLLEIMAFFHFRQLHAAISSGINV